MPNSGGQTYAESVSRLNRLGQLAGWAKGEVMKITHIVALIFIRFLFRKTNF
jgi:hypothetical protein